MTDSNLNNTNLDNTDHNNSDLDNTSANLSDPSDGSETSTSGSELASGNPTSGDGTSHVTHSDIPDSHPRAFSLRLRHRVEEGVIKGITSRIGLVAHGRGEAFDYLLGENTHDFAEAATTAAAALLLLSEHPVISVNGNTAALIARELVILSNSIPAPLEVNIFHTGGDRERKIAEHLRDYGASDILLPDCSTTIDYIESNRRFVNPAGIAKADTIFVPLEDGDRTEALIKMGRKVITVDLNPLSRTARTATITIVDNLVRAMPPLIESIAKLKEYDRNKLQSIVRSHQQIATLNAAEQRIRSGF